MKDFTSFIRQMNVRRVDHLPIVVQFCRRLRSEDRPTRLTDGSQIDSFNLRATKIFDPGTVEE